MKKVYLDMLEEICQKWGNVMMKTQEIIAEIDTFQSLAYSAKKYRYARPKLISGQKKVGLNVKI